MIKQGIPVRDFLGHYDTQYQKVMSQKPARSAWDYDKNMSIISVFNMLLERIRKEGYDENLLAFISCFGPRRVTVNLMGQACESGDSSFSSDADWSDARQMDEITWLDRLWNDRLAFQVMTGQLENLCVLKRNRDNEGTIVSISLHDSIARWRFETLTNDMREKWIITAAYALSKSLPEIIDQKSQMKFLPLVKHFYSSISRCMEPQSLEAPGGKFCHHYGTLMTRFAKLYLNSWYTVEGESVFLQAISYQKIVQMSSWPKGRPTLLLLKGFATMLSKNGKMEDAAETVKALHDASMEQLGPGDEVTCWAAGRLPAVRDTKHRNANDERRAIIASQGEKLGSSTPGLTSNESLQVSPPRLVLEYNAKSSTRLRNAAMAGDIETMTFELDRGADINDKTGKSSMALSGASHEGHAMAVQLLLDRGADVNARIGTRSTALHMASSKGHLAVVEILLRYGADVKIEHEDYGTALHDASGKGHIAIAGLLLSHGADVDATARIGGTALQIAVTRGYTLVAKLLLIYGADANLCSESNHTPLHEASREGHTAMVELLLSHGANVDAQNHTDGTALQIAAGKGHQSIVELLLDKGADINAQRGKCGHALYSAACRGYRSLVERLLTEGADVNAEYVTYGTALHAAVSSDYVRIVQLLIKNGADVNARSKWGTPLQIALHQGRNGVVNSLKAAGARDDDERIPSSTEADDVELSGSGEMGQ